MAEQRAVTDSLHNIFAATKKLLAIFSNGATSPVKQPDNMVMGQQTNAGNLPLNPLGQNFPPTVVVPVATFATATGAGATVTGELPLRQAQGRLPLRQAQGRLPLRQAQG